MALIERPCSRCGSACEVGVGQAVSGGRLYWHRGYRCERCGHMLEEDGVGEMPVVYREAVLQQEGEWGLEVDSPELRVRSEVVRVLREALGFSLAEAKTYFEKLPGCVVKGTQAEMVYLSKLLAKRGVDVTVRQVACGPVHAPQSGEAPSFRPPPSPFQPP